MALGWFFLPFERRHNKSPKTRRPHAPTMSTAIHLQDKGFRCEIAPALGASLAGLWLNDIPVLRSTPAVELLASRQAGSYPLAPYSNRIGQATLHWAGKQHALTPNNLPEPHTMHGVAWQRAWTVLKAEPQHASMRYRHESDAAWPFAFEVEQTFDLHGDTLSMALIVTNLDSEPMPAGLGWHPYFVKRSGCHIAFEAQGRWEMGADKLPTHRLPSSGLATACANLDIDHCFDGWAGSVRLQDDLLNTSISANLQHLVVFTNQTRGFVAIEPVSHVNNAAEILHTKGPQANYLGLRTLACGQSMAVQMRIAVALKP